MNGMLLELSRMMMYETGDRRKKLDGCLRLEFSVTLTHSVPYASQMHGINEHGVFLGRDVSCLALGGDFDYNSRNFLQPHFEIRLDVKA